MDTRKAPRPVDRTQMKPPPLPAPPPRRPDLATTSCGADR